MATSGWRWDDTLLERLERYTDKSGHGGCWLWMGASKGNGYGQLGWRGKNCLPHRLWYEEMVGPIPEGLEIDHLCRVRSCVNPDHLEPVTPRENKRRAWGYDRYEPHCETCQCHSA